MAYQYNYKENSTIRRLEVAKNPSDITEATIYAPDNDPKGLLGALPEYLSKYGIATYLDVVNGQNVLKAMHFGKDTNLRVLLDAGGFTEGNPNKVKIKINPQQSLSTLQKIRQNGIKIAGAMGLAGHAALLTSGVIAKDKARIVTGITYGTCAALNTIYGTGIPPEKFTGIWSDLQQYLVKENIEVPTLSCLSPLALKQQQGMLKTGYDTFKAHSLLVTNAIGAIGNVAMIKSGISDIKTEGFASGAGRAGQGGIALLGSTVGVLLPEMKEDEKKKLSQRKSWWSIVKEGKWNEAAHEAPRRFIDMLRRAPLAFQGIILLADNMSMIFDAHMMKKRYEWRVTGGFEENKLTFSWKKGFYRENKTTDSHIDQLAKINTELHTPVDYTTLEHKEAWKAYAKTGKNLALREKKLNELNEVEKYPWGWAFSAVTAATWTMASTFNALAKKNRVESKDAKILFNDIYAYVATMITAAPENQQETLLKKSAEYLSTNKEIHVKREDIEAGIREKFDIIKQGPWYKANRSVPVDSIVTEEKLSLNEPAENKTWLNRVTDPAKLAPDKDVSGALATRA